MAISLKDIHELRRLKLRVWVAKHHDGVLTHFARSVHRSPAQLLDVLRGRKGFGERLARELEARAQMVPGYLDAPSAAMNHEMAALEIRHRFHGINLTVQAAELFERWEALNEHDRLEIELDILHRHAKLQRVKKDEGGGGGGNGDGKPRRKALKASHRGSNVGGLNRRTHT